MKLSLIRSCLVTLLMCATQLVAFPAAAATTGTGALNFTSTGNTVTAGKANSWMKPLWDFSVPTSSSTALPDAARSYTVSTRQTANGIELIFTWIDTTRDNLSANCIGTPGNILCNGESIKIFINPNNSRDASLQGDEHQFEIALAKKGLANSVSTIVHSKPKSTFGVYSWGTLVGSTGTCGIAVGNNGTAGGIGGASCNVQDSLNQYTVVVSISWNELGIAMPRDFGLAIAMINDLGVNDSTGKAQLTASSFPLTMPVDSGNNPDWHSIQALPATGVWAQPNQWGLGYVNTPSTSLASVTFDLTPASWLAGAIRLSKCGVTNWAPSAASAISANGVWRVEAQGSDQASIPGWYKYYPANTCQMGLWIKASNANAATVRGRLLVVWGHPNAGNTAFGWSMVTLTDPIDFAGGGDSITREVWADVPAQSNLHQGNGLHPCMRVYLLPETVIAASLPAFTNAIDKTWDDGALAVITGSHQMAQMNFTNLAAAGTSCSVNGSLVEQCSFPMSHRMSESPLRKVAYHPDMMLAQNDVGGRTVSVGKAGGKTDGKPDPMARVDVTAFGVEAPKAGQSYVFVEALGGLAWAGPASVFKARKSEPFVFEVGNPAVRYVDYSTPKPTIVPSPARKIFLATHVAAEPGASATVNIAPIKEKMAPGETVTANAVVAIVPQGPCKCACGDVECRLKCNQLAANDSGSISGVLALIGTLGVGGFAFLRRRRNQASSDERAEG